MELIIPISLRRFNRPDQIIRHPDSELTKYSIRYFRPTQFVYPIVFNAVF